MLQMTDTTSLSDPRTGLVVALGLLALGALYLLQSPSSLPLANGKRSSEWRSTNAQKRFLANGRALIKEGLAKWPAFNIISDNGRRLVLSPKYAHEIRSHDALSFGRAIATDFHAELPGFEPFKQGTRADEIVQDAVRMKLTQSLGSVTKPLSDETTHALQKNWTDNHEWHAIPLKSTLLQIVAQLSSKVFLGDQLCRNPDWLRITVDYTVDSFFAAEDLRLWPSLLRPIVVYFLSTTRKIQAEVEEARKIIVPVLERRKAEKQATISNGEAPKKYADAMEWMEQCAKGRPYDAAVAQLGLSLGAIHTTSDMLTQVLYDIMQHDGLVEELRKEIITVIESDGWAKTTLYKLKLMDSVLKESQRLKPTSIVSMRRQADRKITLADGTIVPKDSMLFVSGESMWDDKVYPEALRFDPYRFLKLRDMPGHETSAQLVSPSPEHMGFGFGKHACPGRFFAANEIKIALCHILLKYDVRFTEQWIDPKPLQAGLGMVAEPRAQIQIRRRVAEIEL
ncbi:cytochrome P450 [Aspergillus karnatakaensis]|uniref:cytochrome P450 n=1 Tax=Aspergillus karnatakaensis TaxID=1810916 RepID=UPI003CCE1CF8